MPMAMAASREMLDIRSSTRMGIYKQLQQSAEKTPMDQLTTEELASRRTRFTPIS